MLFYKCGESPPFMKILHEYTCQTEKTEGWFVCFGGRQGPSTQQMLHNSKGTFEIEN